MRLHAIRIYTESCDPFFDSVPINLWSMVEVNVGILCASIPCLKRYFPRASDIGARTEPGINITVGRRVGCRMTLRRASLSDCMMCSMHQRRIPKVGVMMYGSTPDVPSNCKSQASSQQAMIATRFPELVEKIRPIRDRNGQHTRPKFEVVWVGMWMCAFNGQTWVVVEAKLQSGRSPHCAITGVSAASCCLFTYMNGRTDCFLICGTREIR